MSKHDKPAPALDPGVAARAALPAKEREALDALLQDAMARWGQRDLSSLLDQGADVDSKYPYGKNEGLPSPVWGMAVSMLAAQKLGQRGQHAEAFPAMERVLRMCDPRAVDLQGLTPLMHAASEGSLGVEILAPRSDLLAVCGDMGSDFDAGWPALFFAVNTRSGGDFPRRRRVCELLVHPGIWSVRSREGRDVFDCAERLGPAPQIVDCLRELRSMHAARAQALELRLETPQPSLSKPTQAL
jgi:hypothetical protein